MTELLASSEVSRRLGIPMHTLLYHIERGHLPDAEGRLGGVRVFSEAQLPVMLEKVAAMRAAGKLTSKRRSADEDL